ncbi:hypothetical protein [Spirochaeta isovalerica]|uniref:Uncharacterized protein n=1 Tax=Spirochaeta isovalerica TaxID=150 RepID=A0A841R9Q2_9SPIO|nr:hypothetical protein [Spirochaeta isovalerica]MBB6480635.1 hypothetical protein [Spirochaeta isovalerica]
MKRKILSIVFVLIFVVPFAVSSQSSVKGNSVNGATGIVTTPTARIGWEYSDLGLDFGYSFLYGNGTAHVPRVTFSFLKKAEIGVAFNIRGGDDWDFLYHGKFQFYMNGGSAVAMGVMGDLSNVGGSSDVYLTPYLVASYSGNFFKWPAVTTMMFGWRMLEAGSISSNFAFSMGFELALAPQVFKNYVFWISDFSNYSFAERASINARDRGAFNTGIRIDPVKKGKFKLVFDLIGTDLLESSRGLSASATFGIGF